MTKDGIIQILNEVISSQIQRIGSSSNLEIEAKFGLILDRSSGSRISLPVVTECILADVSNIRFESDIGLDVHRAMNRYLNNMVTGSKAFSYLHTKTIDSFIWHSGAKLRLTKNQTDGYPIELIEKTRLLDISLHFPNAPFDVRISINTEDQKHLELFTQSSVQNTSTLGERKKDRIRYTQKSHGMRVDLTQVSSNENGLMHELEIECPPLDSCEKIESNCENFVSLIRTIAFAIRDQYALH